MKDRRLICVNDASVFAKKKKCSIKDIIINIILYAISSIIRIIPFITFVFRNRFTQRI